MILFPAIDLIEGKAVRLFQGDYSQKTVYGDDPAETASAFARAGADHIHLVDLDGAKAGAAVNAPAIRRIIEKTGLKAEVGGGIRNEDTVKQYLDIGVERVILGTAAVTRPDFLEKCLSQYGGKIAVGVDIRENRVAVKGWTEVSADPAEAFCRKMAGIGVQTLIVTDISRDGAMRGTNLELYERLSVQCDCRLIASGGISSLEELVRLKGIGVYGAILGKALYTQAVDLKEAVEVSR